MRFTCLTYDARQRLILYATDEGTIVAVSDEMLSKYPFTVEETSLKATILPPGTRHFYFYAGDPTRVRQVPLDRFLIAGWTGYAKYLAPWGKDEWVFSDPMRVTDAPV